MTKAWRVLTISLFILLLGGCQVAKVETISQAELSQLTNNNIRDYNKLACSEQDKHEVMALPSSPLQKRVDRLVKVFPTNINNTPITYRVYLNTVPTAWASLNGCVRINSGLINMLDDNELQAVIAHEVGHIVLKHSISAFKNAKVAEVNTTTGKIMLINEQTLVWEQEFAADQYAYTFFEESHFDTDAIISMLSKLGNYQKTNNSAYPDIALRKEKLSK
ncbi:M48 family metalloprotease [Orbaceae bacterium ac157xtp]